MTKHILAMSYKPKIEKVFLGICCQTIRIQRKKPFEVGDTATIFEWSGKPYHSRWGRRLEVEITDVEDIIIYDDIVRRRVNEYECENVLWSELDFLAEADYIEPPTGEELKKVLTGGKKIPQEGIKMQIIRWREI